jgi:hypothetical protein
MKRYIEILGPLFPPTNFSPFLRPYFHATSTKRASGPSLWNVLTSRCSFSHPRNQVFLRISLPCTLTTSYVTLFLCPSGSTSCSRMRSYRCVSIVSLSVLPLKVIQQANRPFEILCFLQAALSIFSLSSIPAHVPVLARSDLLNSLVLYCFAYYWSRSSWQCAMGSVRTSSLGSWLWWWCEKRPCVRGTAACQRCVNCFSTADRRVNTKRHLRRRNNVTAKLTIRASQ